MIRQAFKTQSDSEIVPVRGQFLNHADFPGAVPFFQAFLAEDSFIHRAVLLESHEAVYAVVTGEAGDCTGAMLVEAGDEV